MASPDAEQVREALKDVIDPELGFNIVDLGLIYDIEVDGGRVEVTMTMTTPGCPATDYLERAVDHRIRDMDGVDDVLVNVVWAPPWSPALMSEAARRHLGMA